MAPLRGSKKRKKTEKKPEENAYASGSSDKDGPLDWWDEFFRRINAPFYLFMRGLQMPMVLLPSLGFSFIALVLFGLRKELRNNPISNPIVAQRERQWTLSD